MEPTVECDLLIIGAGPAGLFAAYYAGFHDLRTVVVDSLPEPGGQVSALYPEKLIYDVAGFPAIRGRSSSIVWSSRRRSSPPRTSSGTAPSTSSPTTSTSR